MGAWWAVAEGPARLRDVLQGVGARLRVGNAYEIGVLHRRWAAIVGSAIADHSEPTSFRNGVLRVRVESPAWATEIGSLADEIRRLANAELEGGAPVTEVRVWTGPGTRARPSPPTDPPQRSQTAVPEDLPASPGEALDKARRAWAQRVSKGPARVDREGS